MATLKNLRAFAPGTNDTDTSKVAVDASDTGSANGGILRKINLNVDLATQNELNEAFFTLSAAISSTQGDLGNYYTKSEVNTISTDLSTSLTGDIEAAVADEAALRQAADEAITASLSAYEVTVEKDATAEEGYAASYTVKQGGVALSPKINIPKDYLVKSAELCVVSEAGVPYAEAQVGDKYIDFTINTADASETAQHIYLPVNDLVDVYTGAETDTASVTIGQDNSISVTVKDYASKTYVDGVSADVSAAAAADIAAALAEAKDYTDDLSNAFEPRVAANEAVSQFVEEMSATWGGGGTAIQSVDGDDVYIAATTDAEHNVTVAATSDLCAAVATANDALQTVSKGTDGTYVTTTIGTKANNDQTVAVELTFGELSAGTSGVAKAEEAKAYVDAAVAGKNVDAEGDGLVEASADNNKVTVNASDALCAVVAKVEAASADWDDAVAVADVVKSTSATWDTVANKADLTALEAETTAREAADAFLSGKIDALSVSLNAAEGDAYVSAYVDGNIVKVEAQDRTKAAIDRVEGSADDWDEVSAKADLTAVNELTSALSDAITAETERATAAEQALSNEIDGLSAVYKTIAKINSAVSSARFDLPISDDYADIDAIIADVIEIRKALNALRESTGPAPTPSDYDKYLKISINYNNSEGTDAYVVGVSNGTGTVLKSIPEAGQSQMHTTLTPEGNNTYTIGGYDPDSQTNVTGTYTIDTSNEDNPVQWVSGDCNDPTWPSVEVLTKEQAEALINS